LLGEFPPMAVLLMVFLVDHGLDSRGGYLFPNSFLL
jgi:hypothetical protein